MYYGLSVQNSSENLAPALGGDENSDFELTYIGRSLREGEVSDVLWSVGAKLERKSCSCLRRGWKFWLRDASQWVLSIGTGGEWCIMVCRCKIRAKMLLLPSAGMKILTSRCLTMGALYRDGRWVMYYGLSVQNSSENLAPAFGGDENSDFEMPHNGCSL